MEKYPLKKSVRTSRILNLIIPTLVIVGVAITLFPSEPNGDDFLVYGILVFACMLLFGYTAYVKGFSPGLALRSGVAIDENGVWHYQYGDVPDFIPWSEVHDQKSHWFFNDLMYLIDNSGKSRTVTYCTFLK